MDSLLPHEITRLKEEGCAVLRHPPEKDQSDLELALLYAAEKGATWIRILGAVGGRFDQMLANMYLMALPDLEDSDIAVVAGKQHITLLRAGKTIIEGDKGDTISLMPVSGDVIGIRTKALKYPLEDEKLTFGPARGISNIMLEEKIEISLQQGVLLCVHTKGRA